MHLGKYSSLAGLLLLGTCILVLGWFAQYRSIQTLQIRGVEYRSAPEADQNGAVSHITGPVSVKEIKRSLELNSLDISFEFSTQEPTFSYGNLFQTGDSIDAIRMELQPPSNLVLVLGDGKLFPLSNIIQIGKYHDVQLKYDRDRFLKVSVDKTEVLNITDKGVLAGKFDISNMVVGSGLARQRTLIGSVKDFNLNGAYSYYGRTAQLSWWILIFLCCAVMPMFLRGTIDKVTDEGDAQPIKGQLHSNHIGLLMFAALGIGLFMALRLPIYPDEVAFRILLERFFQSGGYKTSLTPYCVEGFQVVPPHLTKLSAIAWSLLGQINSAIAYRLFPSTLLVLSLGSLYWYVRRHYKGTNPWFLVLFVPGVSIYALVILRPEIFIATSMVILAISGLSVARIDNSNPGNLLLISVIVTVLFILVSYVHPKALYLVLPTLITLGLVFEKVIHSPIRVACVTMLVFSVILTTYDSIHIHSLGYVSCKSFPEIQNKMTSMGVNILGVFDNLSNFISDLSIANDKMRYDRTLSQLIFRSDYDSAVLPNVPASFLLIKVVNFMIKVAALATFAYVTFITILNAIKLIRKRRIEREFLVYLGIGAVAACQFYLNSTKNWYDISLSIFSLGILAFIGSNISQLNTETPSTKVIDITANMLQWAIAFAALFSLGINYQFIYSEFVHGYVGPGISTQMPLSQIERFIQTQFKYDYEDNSRPIITDDLTYHPFRAHAKIYPVTYLLLNANQRALQPNANNEPASVIDVVLNGGRLTGITRCNLWSVFDSTWKTTLLDRRTFITDQDIAIDICRWEVH